MQENTGGWEEFKLLLIKNFVRTDKQRILRTNLRELKCAGRFDKFVEKFLSITDKISNMPEQEIIYIFLDALSPATRKELLKDDPETLTEAIRLATIQEECSDQNSARRVEFVKKLNYVTEFPKKPRYNNYQKQKFQNGSKYPNKQPFNKDHTKNNNPNWSSTNEKKKVQCYNCKGFGHIARNCNQKKLNIIHNVCCSDTRENVLLSIEGKVDDRVVKLSFDSGATASIMSRKAVKKFNFKRFDSEVQIKTADNNISNVIGITESLTVNIKDIVITKLKFLIIDHEDHDVLLGLDWFNKTGVGIYPKQNYLMVPSIDKKIQLDRSPRYPDLDFELDDSFEESLVVTMEDSEELDIEETGWDFNEGLPEIAPNKIDLLSAKEVDMFMEVIPTISSVIAKDIRDLKTCNIRKHKIRTGNESPIYIPPYRKSMSEREIINGHIKEMLDAGIIQASSSPWSSPIILIPKPDGSKRFCIDYRKLNSITEPEHWPIPRIDDIFDGLSGSKWYSVIDLKSGYWQMAMDEDSIEKAAFSTPDGHYEPKRMPFGLKNAPADFSRMMFMVLGNFLFVKVYLDDITIHSSTFKEHVGHIKIVCKALKQAGLSINQKKCTWCTKEIKLLGHIISHGSVLMDPGKISALKERISPKCVKDIQIFLGGSGYYRRFIKDYATIALPMTNLLKGTEKFVWGSEQEESFTKLKDALTSYPILKLPDFSKPFILYTDASNYAMGSVLSQKNDENEGGECIIRCDSRTLKNAELNYGISEKECLAFVWSIRKNHVYLYGRKFTVVTDHSALVWLMNISDPTGRLARWSIYLQGYQFEIKHRKGVLHSNADVLSRPPIENNHMEMVSYLNTVTLIDPLEDEPLLYRLKNNQFKGGTSRRTVNRINRLLPHYTWENSKLFYRKLTSNNNYLEIPHKSLRKEIILNAHLLGHFQTLSTMNRIKEKYWWKGMERDTIDVIAKCIPCQENHALIHKEHPARATQISYIHERIGIDLVGGFPETEEGYIGVMIITEYLTKYAVVYPIKSKGAKEIAENLFNYIGMFGPPKIILSDQGTEFCNKIVAELLKVVGVEHRVTSAYNPRTNGQAERFNKIFVETLRKFLGENVSLWNKWIPFVTLAYRTRIHSSTGFTPFELMFARRMNTFDNWTNTSDGDDEKSLSQRTKEIKKLIEGDIVEAKENIEKSQASQIKTQDDNHRIQREKLPIGAKVYVKVEGIKNKLEPKYRGPFTIIDYREKNYILENILKERMSDAYPLQRLKLVPNNPEEEPFYEVDKILQHKGETGKEKYLVSWKNFSAKHNSWEPAENFHDKKILREYWKKFKSASKINTLTILMILLFLPLTLAKDIKVVDQPIYWCDQIDVRNTPILHLDECDAQKLLRKAVLPNDSLHKENIEMTLFSKNAWEAQGKAFECFIQEIQLTTYRNVLYSDSRSWSRKYLKLDRAECQTMIRSKRCFGKLMECEEGLCISDGTPTEKYYYLTKHYEQGYKCLSRPREIRVRDKSSMLFGKTCQPVDQFCRMTNSIIVWDDIITKCPLTAIQSLILSKTKNNVYFDKIDRLAFRVIGTDYFCDGVKFYKTTSGLYLLDKTINKDFFTKGNYFQNMVRSKAVDQTRQWDSWKMEHSMAESELDGAIFDAKISIYKNSIRYCNIMHSMINNIKHLNDKYSVVNDPDGNEIVLHSRHGIVFVPQCVKIFNFTFLDFSINNKLQESGCIDEFKITFNIGTVTHIAFLNSERIIKATYTKSECTDKYIIFPKIHKIFVANKGIIDIVPWSKTRSIHLMDNVIASNFPHAFDNFTALVNELKAVSDTILWNEPITEKIIQTYSHGNDSSTIISTAIHIRQKIRKSAIFVRNSVKEFTYEAYDIIVNALKIIGIIAVIVLIIFILTGIIYISSLHYKTNYMMDSNTNHIVKFNTNPNIGTAEESVTILPDNANVEQQSIKIYNPRTEKVTDNGFTSIIKPKIEIERLFNDYDYTSPL